MPVFAKGLHMQKWIICFVLGLLSLGLFHTSPSPVVVFILLAVLTLMLRKFVLALLISGYCAGLGYGLLQLGWWQEGRLDINLQGETVILSGTVMEVKELTEQQGRIMFRVNCLWREQDFAGQSLHSATNVGCENKTRLIQLSWYRPNMNVLPGQNWLLAAKLRWGHSFANPGGFDYERWLMTQGVQAVGYVRPAIEARQMSALEQSGLGLESDWWPTDIVARGVAKLNLLRYQIKQAIGEQMAQSPYRGIVIALVVGDRQHISEPQKNVFRDTGTAHLIAISGLHVGLLAGLAYFLLRGGLLFCPALMAKWPAQKLALVGACISATLYAAMAGFATPTLRALIMLYLFCFLRWRDLPLMPFRTLLVAALLVLLLHAFDVFNAGFWLSFGAVAVIFVFFGSHSLTRSRSLVLGQSRGWLGWMLGVQSKLLHWGRLQWAIFLGLTPLVLLFIGQVSLLSPLVNLALIPIFAWIIVPMSLLATALMPLSSRAANALFNGVDTVFQGIWPWLQSVADYDYSTLYPSLQTPLLTILILVLVALLLGPRGLPLKSYAVVMATVLVLMIFPLDSVSSRLILKSDVERQAVMPAGELKFTLLDVGQGLSAVLQTRGHTLVYDLGPRFGRRLDAGSAVVVPFLLHEKIDSVDTLILSHDDIDHVGGLDSFLNRVAVQRVIAAENVVTGNSKTSLQKLAKVEKCRQNFAWQWDDVNFMVYAIDRPEARALGLTSNAEVEKVVHGSEQFAAFKSLNDNNQSCVLKVWGEGFSLLLPGDIELWGEIQLLNSFPRKFPQFAQPVSLQADILVVPHHGSNTSTSVSLLNRVQPQHALVSAGYLNRFGHPHGEVLSRLARHQVAVFATDQSGALQYQLQSGGRLGDPIRYRQASRKLWHHP